MSVTQSDVKEKLRAAVSRHQAGDLATAADMYAQVLNAEPDNADAWHLSGLAQFAAGNTDHAERSVRRAVQLNPKEPEFQSNLAAILVNLKRSEEAESVCRNVLRIDSSHAATLCHLGTALRQQRRLNESLESFRRSLDANPDAAALCNLGSVLSDLGRADEAKAAFLQAIDVNPTIPQVHINLGAVQRELGEIDAALESLSAAEALSPSSYEVHVNRANLYLELGRALDAIEEYQRAIAVNSELPAAVAGLGRALQQVSCWEESLEAQRLAAELAPDDHKYQSSYLYAASLSPLLTPEAVWRRHAQWGKRIEAAVDPVSRHRNAAIANRKLRIGYVSPDLRSHATMRFLYPLLEAHDHSEFEIVFYSETTAEDSTTEKAKQLSDGWCATRGLADFELCERIMADRIDILVDLAGHTAGNRLPVFARKPAPVQVTFLGYPNTTGLSRIDYFLTDAIREPGANNTFFTETPVLLPHGACCYRAANAPEVAEPPLVRNGAITFGSTHRLEKISPQTLQLWQQVMATVPHARLLMFRDVLENNAVRQQMLTELTEAGIPGERVDFGWELPEEHLKVYADIDIMLDVFPWGSGTIAYDAMWMGVPIPTLAGDRGGCRATASLMHHSGFPELIAESEDDYIRIVAELAESPELLCELRQQIRPAMNTTVGNGERFARDIETAFRSMWKDYVRESMGIKGARSR